MKIVLVLLILLPTIATAKIKVVATLSELSWLVGVIGGDKIKLKPLLYGAEDPHFIDAAPSFILKTSSADLLVYNGFDLEIGWLPKVLERAGNSKVNFGAKGHCIAGKNIKPLQVIQNYDRSMGDIHPAGNPHFLLAPNEMRVAAKNVLDCLKKVDPKNTKTFEVNYKRIDFEIEQQYLKHKKVLAKYAAENYFVEYHREFSYFLSNFGLSSAGAIEKTPGVPPSATYMAKRALQLKKMGVKLILASTVNPERYIEKFSKISKVPYRIVPTHIQLNDKKFDDFFKLQEFLVKEITRR